MSANGNTELPIEVPNVRELNGLGANAQEQAGVSVSTAAQITQFPTEIPSVNDRFCNHDDALFDQGYDSEGQQLYYDPFALDEDADDLDEEAITCTPPQPIVNALPPLPPPVAGVPESSVLDVKKLEVAEPKIELRKRGRGVEGTRMFSSLG